VISLLVLDVLGVPAQASALPSVAAGFFFILLDSSIGGFLDCVAGFLLLVGCVAGFDFFLCSSRRSSGPAVPHGGLFWRRAFLVIQFDHCDLWRIGHRRCDCCLVLVSVRRQSDG
jgi:hypothetical protein